jgi:hypothetical protein
VKAARRVRRGAVGKVAARPTRWPPTLLCNTATGSIRFDNYEGRWGDPKQVDRLLQAYAVERARLEARKRGHQVVEQSLADGSIKLTIQIGGAA